MMKMSMNIMEMGKEQDKGEGEQDEGEVKRHKMKVKKMNSLITSLSITCELNELLSFLRIKFGLPCSNIPWTLQMILFSFSFVKRTQHPVHHLLAVLLLLWRKSRRSSCFL